MCRKGTRAGGDLIVLRSQLHEARVCATLQVHCCLQLQLLLGNASASVTELLRYSLHMLRCNRCRCFRFQVCCRALQLKVAQPMLLRLLKSQQLQQSSVTQLPASAKGEWVQGGTPQTLFLFELATAARGSKRFPPSR
jgi:hypothetical protein